MLISILGLKEHFNILCNHFWGKKFILLNVLEISKFSWPKKELQSDYI